MTTPAPACSCPLPRAKVVDAYFMEHRAKLLDIAAFLDRVDRAAAGPDAESAGEDYRVTALKEAARILLDGHPNRAKRILELLSDPTKEPIPKSPGKGAAGAWKESH